MRCGKHELGRMPMNEREGSTEPMDPKLLAIVGTAVAMMLDGSAKPDIRRVRKLSREPWPKASPWRWQRR